MYYAKQETDARMQMAAVAKNFFILSDILIVANVVLYPLCME